MATVPTQNVDVSTNPAGRMSWTSCRGRKLASRPVPHSSRLPLTAAAPHRASAATTQQPPRAQSPWPKRSRGWRLLGRRTLEAVLRIPAAGCRKQSSCWLAATSGTCRSWASSGAGPAAYSCTGTHHATGLWTCRVVSHRQSSAGPHMCFFCALSSAHRMWSGVNSDARCRLQGGAQPAVHRVHQAGHRGAEGQDARRRRRLLGSAPQATGAAGPHRGLYGPAGCRCRASHRQQVRLTARRKCL